MDVVHAKNRPPRKNGKPYGYFHEMEMSTSEWAQVHKINNKLEVGFIYKPHFYFSCFFHLFIQFTRADSFQSSQPFLKMTLEMEGDGPTGCMVIPQYVELRNTLDKKIDVLTASDAMYPMLAKMREKTQEYLDEALSCQTLVMATVLHPFFRLKFFKKWFGTTSAITIKAESNLRSLYCNYEADAPSKAPIPVRTSKDRGDNVTSSPKAAIFAADSDEDSDSEDILDTQIDDYLRMGHKMNPSEYNVADPHAALEWWKVSCNHYSHFFISGADICSINRQMKRNIASLV